MYREWLGTPLVDKENLVKWKVSLTVEVDISLVLLSKKGDVVRAEGKAREMLTHRFRLGHFGGVRLEPTSVEAKFAEEI